MKYQKFDYKSFTLHTIKTDKFRNCSIEFIFRNNAKTENFTKLNMLASILTYSSKKYPKCRDLNIELENLYNMSFRGISTRLGSCHINNFIANFLDPKYCDKGTLKEMVELPLEVILNPNISNDEFDHQSFKIVKNSIKDSIERVKENATRYAFRRAFIAMDSESPISASVTGNQEDLDIISPSNLYQTYQEFISESILDIYVIGNLDMEEVRKIIEKKLILNSVKNYEIPMYLTSKKRTKVNIVQEKGKFEQARLIMLYNLNDLTKIEYDATMHLYNYLLGGGSLTSKLGKYLREENSLCYSTSSMYQKYDNLLLLYSGIDKKNYDLAVKLSKKAVKEMAEGHFTDQELEEAKISLISSLKINQDNMGGIISNYLFHNLDNVPLYEDRIQDLKKITRKDIINIAKKIKLNTIFLLSNGDE